MEAPSPKENITFESFNLESDRHKPFNFIFKNENNRSLCISALYKEDILTQNYEKVFALDSLKNIAIFLYLIQLKKFMKR